MTNVLCMTSCNLQNQFFISSLPEEGVENAVVSHVRAKVVDAYKRKKTFRVIICIPLLPEFGGVSIHQSHMRRLAYCDRCIGRKKWGEH